jgi:hypothetical protein
MLQLISQSSHEDVIVVPELSPQPTHSQHLPSLLTAFRTSGSQELCFPF